MTPLSDEMNRDRRQQWAKVAKQVVLMVSAGLMIFLSITYWFRPDTLAAVTFFPVWFWLIPGLISAGVGFNRKNRKYGLVVSVVWVIFSFSFAGETSSMLRCWKSWPAKEWVDAREEGRAIRVISLNCAGKREAAEEVSVYNPDIVLLQESPDRKSVEMLAEKLFGKSAGVMWDIDTSIIAKGKISPGLVIGKHRHDGVGASVELAEGYGVEVFSVRLIPPICRFDLWSPECWRAQAENRRFRRGQVALIAEKLKTIPAGKPVILGGDFNAPAGDGAMSDLRFRLTDTFSIAGIGWGDTGINEVPVIRVDQIWTSDHFKPVAVVARKTLHSDHRMVVCDLMIHPFPTTRPSSSGKRSE